MSFSQKRQSIIQRIPAPNRPNSRTLGLVLFQVARKSKKETNDEKGLPATGKVKVAETCEEKPWVTI